MSKARKPSGFAQAHYDKILLLSALLLLTISSAGLLIGLGANREEVTPQELNPASTIAVEPVDVSSIDRLIGFIDKPYQFPSSRKLMVGDLRVGSIPDGLPIPYDAQTCPFTGKAQPTLADLSRRDSDGDGMPDEWEIKHQLNLYDSNDAAVDSDSDGFSNLDECLSGSDPKDLKSFPPPVAKLRLEKAQVNPFKLRFVATSQMPNGEVAYQINLRTLEKTYFASMNGDVEGFKIVNFDENAPEGPTLTIQQGDKTLKLVKGRIRDESGFTANLVLLLDKRRFKRNIGETIALHDETYKVVDIREDRVVLRDEKTDKKIDVGLISDEERSLLTADPEPAKAAPATTAAPPAEQGF